MGSYEATNVVLARIKHLEPENATKIMGYLLMNLEENQLVRLACSPDPVLHSLILRVRTQLGFSSNSSSTPSTPSSPTPLNPIARPPSGNPFSLSSPRVVNNGFDFSRNPASPSSHGWPLFPNNPISPKSSPSLPYENICTGSSSAPFFSPRGNGDCSSVNESVNEQKMNGYFSFLNETSKTEDFVDPQVELVHGAQNRHALSNGDTPFHRRSFSASEVCMGPEEGAAGIGLRPCLYFSRGFCKNGSNCKFLHGGLGESWDASSGAIVGSPSKFDGFDQREEFLRLKAAQQQKLASMSPSSYEKYLHLLLQQQDPQRATAAAALMMRQREEYYRRCRQERSDFLTMMSAEKSNSASRQIYLTFPAESTFKDEDVSEYFSKFGLVQDVRIPYQQKRMFGFVTFVYPDTVRLILSKGNPHFICDSRVLVKPYKEKGKVSDKRQQHQQQQLEMGDFSPCLSPSAFDSKEPFDLHLGGRMFCNPHEILFRRKLEEQELQQAIELQETRLMNLQLPDFKNNRINCDQRSLSVDAAFPSEQQLQSHISSADYNGSPASPVSLPTAEKQHPQKDVKPDVSDNGVGRFKDSLNEEVFDLSNSVEQVLPDNLFASPTKAAGENLSDPFVLAPLNESAVSLTTSCENKFEERATSSDMASH